ncbi:hypothetical protein [Patulibacter sp.]|uniref:hypothetical protein n=1 Tax=Patulibacter sp. TaxID=1912859 RepID=UPI0027174A4B|nr:hypothetical protein [Patulibacter sp.]MDO9407867.1 hypothetical protein [Patulibacter sp.]
MSHVDRWFVATAAGGTARTALLVVDVDIDDALPVVTRTPVLSVVGSDGPGAWRPVATAVLDLESDSSGATSTADDEDPDAQRRARLGRSVAHAIGTHVRAGDAVARLDAGRFAVLRGTLDDGATARSEAVGLARGIEDALVGRPEGFGVRVTTGAVTLRADVPREGRSALGAVTTAMLEGKLMTDDRVVVAVAPGG